MRRTLSNMWSLQAPQSGKPGSRCNIFDFGCPVSVGLSSHVWRIDDHLETMSQTLTQLTLEK
jgi:hypothetical protein